MRRLLRRIALLSLAGGALTVLLALPLLGSGSPARTLTIAGLLWDVADGPGSSGGLTACSEPGVTLEQVPINGGTMPADRYQCSGAKGGMVLIPGLTAEGKDDPALGEFARVLARAGFDVLVPDLPGRRRLAGGTADIAPTVAAAAWLGQARGGHKVGLTAISFASGPALLAAATPAGQQWIGFVTTIGAYHDLPDMVAWVTTGRLRGPDKGWVAGTPPALALWSLVIGNLDFLNDIKDRALLHEIARRRWTDGTAGISDLVSRLGPEGRALWSLLSNQDPDRVAELLAGQPERLAAELSALNLARADLSALSIPVLLIHGADDPVIPMGESVALAAALPSGSARLRLIGTLGHTGDAGLRVADLMTLWGAGRDLILLRDGLEP